ncbi:MAG: hypothetical protein E6237_00975 [Peptostreptococcus anaerobius]|uniref:hypothetical protein n=1 Tax=Peptostreptococcus anaerobius TaxID=1261 RepID=UPI00290A7DA9|nr:hypothetical protein [Peptostreptococcus anaerobius]MDU5095397.1 hypothetical protein [Peptostreptococcus anaerobius]
MKNKTSEAQKKASRNWEQKNKEKAKIGSYKRTARLFINKHSNLDDLEELKNLIVLREEELKNRGGI